MILAWRGHKSKMKIHHLTTRRQQWVPIKNQIASCIHLSLGKQAPHSTKAQNNSAQVSSPNLSLRKLIFMQRVLFYLNCAPNSLLSMRESRPWKIWEKSITFHRNSQINMVQRANSSSRWQSMTLNLASLPLKSLLLHTFSDSKYEVADCRR